MVAGQGGRLEIGAPGEAFEGTLRELERRRRLTRGTVEGLIDGAGA